MEIDFFRQIHKKYKSKIKKDNLQIVLNQIIRDKKLNIDLEVDGGINFENCRDAKKAGANVLVSGSTIFKENNQDLKKNINLLRTS